MIWGCYGVYERANPHTIIHTHINPYDVICNDRTVRSLQGGASCDINFKTFRLDNQKDDYAR